MGGGIISLVANGAQDVYLTGNPQITWFKVIYRRYTNFAMETIEHSIDSTRPTGEYTVKIMRNGDLATKTALRVSVPAITAESVFPAAGTNEFGKIAWVRRLGHALIKSVEVKIGGSTIDKHVGVWMDLFYELTHTSESERGYRELIGDVPEMTALSGRTVAGSDEQLLPAYTLYIPFQFWFCRNYGLALPLIALQYHEVTIQLVLERISKLVCWTGPLAPNLTNFTFGNSGVMVDYVYLESAERRRYAQVGHEYLVEQVQFGGEETVSINSQSVSNNQKFKLSFNHPTKELVWALKLGAFNGDSLASSLSNLRGKFLCYTHEDDWAAALDYAAKNLAESCVFVNPNTIVNSNGDTVVVFPVLGESQSPIHQITAGTTSLSSSDEQFWDTCNNGQRVTVELRNVSSDAANGTKARLQSGETIAQVNETTHLGANVKVFAYDTYFGDTDFPIVLGSFASPAYDLFDMIESAHVVVSHDDGASFRIECVSVKHSLSLNDVSVPVPDHSFDWRSYDAKSFGVHRDVAVVQPSNYGLRLDGQGNPVQSANIQLNGHERLKLQEGPYFNYYQPQNHHTHAPAEGVNVYSFALHPEKHQPSGTTNLSRIDSTILNLNFADTLRSNNTLKLDMARDTRLYIFAFNYNVLRIMSGMGGLAYSN